ncbi:hypothetical protein Pcinc_016214 [Petrolisthes cinctipes]|uniref:Uncharacterized protein n=1 Tax=Petrolisthes cinctipes TaxID=88211 RepID=A0AAE1FSV5_PETCI|nr:hypothetical protein Pcinc_016214 [Petrolisthes cinctipes]
MKTIKSLLSVSSTSSSSTDAKNRRHRDNPPPPPPPPAGPHHPHQRHHRHQNQRHNDNLRHHHHHHQNQRHHHSPPPSGLPHPPLTHIQESESRQGVSEHDGGGVSKERRDEEHNTLVTSQVLRRTCASADTPRSTFHAALTNTLTAATQGCGETKLWSGSLPSTASEELNQVAHETGLNWEVEQLVWWVVGSQLASVDASWTLSQLHRVQAALAAGVYTEEETAELLHSLTLYIHCQLKRLRALHTTFPVKLVSSNSQHQSQLTYTLRTLGCVERHSCTRALLDQVGQPPVEEDVAAALLRHAHDWWSEVLWACGWHAVGESRVRVGDAAPLLASLPATLRDLNQSYHHVFLTELKIPYASLSHRELCRHLAYLTKALLDSTPLRSGRGVRCQRQSAMENFGIGSPLWSVYKSLGQIYSRMGEECGSSSSELYCPSDYPGCFLASVGAWLTHTHTLHRLHNPPSSPPAPHSSSQNNPLHELLQSYKEAGRWWRELSWPEEETAGVVVVLILQNLTSLASTLCHSLAPHNTPTSTPSHSPPKSSSQSSKSTFYQSLHPHPTSSSTALPTQSTSSSTSESNSTFYHSLAPSSTTTPSSHSTTPSSDTTSEDSSECEETQTKMPPLRQTPSAYFDTKVYRCLATVWGAREAVGQLGTGVVGVNEVVTRLKDSGRNGAADQLETTVTSLLTSVIQNLDSLAHQVIFTAVDKVRERLQVEVEAACEGGEDNTPPLLYLSLHNTVINLQRQLSLSSFPDTASGLSSSSALQNLLSKPSSSSKTTPVLLPGFRNALSTSSVSSKMTQMSLSQSQNLSSSKVMSAPFSSGQTPFPSSQSLVYLSPNSSRNLPSPSSAPDILLSSGSRFPSSSASSSSRPSPVCSSPLLVSSSSLASPPPTLCPQQRLLQQLWDALVVQFMVLVADSIGKRSSEYFSGVVAVLESVFSLLTSPGRLHPATASTPGYQSVVEQARQQRVSTVELISRYYHERYSQQINGTIPITAQVLVRAYCKQPGHLTVRILGARTVAPLAPGAQGRKGPGLGSSSRGTSKYHVQVELVPGEAFPGASLCRTSSSSHSPPHFDDTFEFPTGVCEGEGFLHVSLVTGGGTVTAAAMVVVGEAFLPLPLIPYLDSPSLQNTSLPMTRPAFPPGYAAVMALRTRMWDSRACSFVRQLERRHPEAKPQPHPSPAVPNTYSHS